MYLSLTQSHIITYLSQRDRKFVHMNLAKEFYKPQLYTTKYLI